MMILALLLASTQVAIIDDVVRVPPSEWRMLDVLLRQQAATVQLSYKVAQGRSGVRVALMERSEVDRMRSGKSFRTVAGTSYNSSFTFRATVPRPGDYAILVDNRMEGRDTAEVHLQVSLLFTQSGAVGAFPVRRVPPGKRAVIILISLAFFTAVCGYAWLKLGPALREQP
ncbi:MAG: hypothetical protein NTY38_19125 [Acidobacteria bacterium]|nr:hypothetical protein [Acidobacteriota bacterium]